MAKNSRSLTVGANATPIPGVATEVITPAIAAQWLSTLSFDEQRALRSRHVEYLVAEMRAGRFQQDTLLRIVIERGKAYLTDGQHRLNAIVQSGVPARCIVLRKEVSSYQEVAEDYTRTDGGIVRTPADALRTFHLDERTGLQPSNINRLGPALNYILTGFATQQASQLTHLVRSKEVRVNAVLAWQEEARAYFDILLNAERANKSQLLRAPVIAVALVTLRHRPKIATDFWSAVAMDDGLKRGMPEKTLLDYLHNNRGADARSCAHHHFISSAWNSAYKGESRSRLCGRKPLTLPIVLLGTPFDGKSYFTY